MPGNIRRSFDLHVILHGSTPRAFLAVCGAALELYQMFMRANQFHFLGVAECMFVGVCVCVSEGEGEKGIAHYNPVLLHAMWRAPA